MCIFICSEHHCGSRYVYARDGEESWSSLSDGKAAKRPLVQEEVSKVWRSTPQACMEVNSTTMRRNKRRKIKEKIEIEKREKRKKKEE